MSRWTKPVVALELRTTPAEPEPQLKTAWIETTTGLRALAPEWRSLTESSGHHAPFFQPEWASASMASFCQGEPLALLTTRRRGELLSVLPLVRSRHLTPRYPLRTLRSISSVHSIRSDLIEGAASDDESTARTWAALKGDPWWNAVVLEDVPEGGAFHKMMNLASRDGYLVAHWRTRLSPFLPITPHGDPFAACPKRYKSFRNRLKGKLERLGSLGSTTFTVESSPETSSLEAFLDLEASGWKASSGSAIKGSQKLRGFYGSVFSEARQRGYLRMYSLLLDGKQIAMHLGLFQCGTYYSPKVAYDERYREYSLGHILMQHIIRDLSAIGAQRFEFLGPNALWKSVWSTSLQRHDTCYIFRPSLAGRTAHVMLASIGLRLRALRHRLRGDPQQLT